MKTDGMANYLGRVMCALALALVAGFVFTTLAPTAAQADEYQYTIRVWAGNNSTVNGSTGVVEASKKFAKGESVNLRDYFDAQVTDQKYYIKGFRVSGQDKLCEESFDVTEDMDFIVAYGVKGDQVSYTLSFVEYGTDKALKNDEGVTSKTLYGNKGDKPVVAFEYVPGYRPLYRNITGTLGDEGTNNWTCEYIKIQNGNNNANNNRGNNAGGNTGGNVAGGGAATGGTNAGGTAAGGANAGAAAGGNAAGGANAGANAGGANAGGNAAGGAAANEPQTEQVIDVDNPLASDASADKSGDSADKSGDSADKTAESKTDDSTQGSGIPVAAIFAGAAAIVAAAAAIVYAVKRRRDGEYQGKLR